MDSETVAVLSLLVVALLGAAFLAGRRMQLYFGEKKACLLSEILVKHCRVVLKGVEPDLYRRVKSFRYGSEVVSYGSWSWQRKACLLVGFELEDQGDRSNVEFTILPSVHSFLAEPGNEKIEAVIRFSKPTEGAGDVQTTQSA